MSTETTTDTFPEVCEWLANEGWHKGHLAPNSSADYSWYRRFRFVAPGCCCNDDKPGIQLVIQAWDFRSRGHSVSFSVDIIAEPKDGVWVKLVAYSIPLNEIRSKLDEQSQKLIRAWQAVNATA